MLTSPPYFSPYQLSPSLSHLPPPTKTYTLSLHDALPISGPRADQQGGRQPACRVRLPARRPRLPRQADVASQRSEEHTSELQSRRDLVCRLLLEKKKKKIN